MVTAEDIRARARRLVDEGRLVSNAELLYEDPARPGVEGDLYTAITERRAPCGCIIGLPVIAAIDLLLEQNEPGEAFDKAYSFSGAWEAIIEVRRLASARVDERYGMGETEALDRYGETAALAAFAP